MDRHDAVELALEIINGSPHICLVHVSFNLCGYCWTVDRKAAKVGKAYSMSPTPERELWKQINKISYDPAIHTPMEVETFYLWRTQIHLLAL